MTGGYLSLKWNSHQTTFLHVLSSLCLNETLSDVTLTCDGKFYAAHKLVLTVCSEYFQKIFEFIEGKHTVIVLKDVKADDLEALLTFMYEGEVNVPQENLADLITAAEYLKIKGLSDPDESSSITETKESVPTNRSSISQSDDSTHANPAKRRRSFTEESDNSLIIDTPDEPNISKDNTHGNFESRDSKENNDFSFLDISIKEEPAENLYSDLIFGNQGKIMKTDSEASLSSHAASSDVQSHHNNIEKRQEESMQIRRSEHLRVSRDDSEIDPSLIVDDETDSDEVHSCPYCPYETKKKFNYNSHLRRHSNDKAFSCSFCSYRSYTKSNLKSHVRKHTGEKPFACPHCMYRSAQSSNIKIHVKRMHKNISFDESPQLQHPQMQPQQQLSLQQQQQQQMQQLQQQQQPGQQMHQQEQLTGTPPHSLHQQV